MKGLALDDVNVVDNASCVDVVVADRHTWGVVVAWPTSWHEEEDAVDGASFAWVVVDVDILPPLALLDGDAAAAVHRDCTSCVAAAVVDNRRDCTSFAEVVANREEEQLAAVARTSSSSSHGCCCCYSPPQMSMQLLGQHHPHYYRHPPFSRPREVVALLAMMIP
jgi:hypothetical protein